VTIVDLDSTNGTFVNGVRVTRRVLRDGDVVQIGSHALFKFRLQDVLEERSHRALVELAMRDGLTELLNRRGFDDCLQRELSYARRHDRVLTLMLFDLDHFKRVNDRYGHAAGDEVLRQIAGRVGELLRREDHFARYGGEEFAIVARDLAGEAARVKAEQVRTVVAARPVAVDAQEICVTVSVGVAAWQPDGDLDAAALLRQADARLYAAKRAGRDRVDTTSPLAA
jgi:diguanylate cyclase (GGDEF)-like protein